jgi:hypothetical protein
LRYLVSCIAVALLVFLGQARVEAGSTYEVSGTFGANLIGNTGLSDGSFTATFEVATPLPLATGGSEAFESYSVSLYNSSSILESTFGSTSPVFLAGIANVLTFGGRIDVATFVDPTSPGSLVLDFSSGFNGTGAVIPFELIYVPRASAFTEGSLFDLKSVRVASGQSQAVPEPSSIITGGIGILMLIGVYARRQRAKVALISGISRRAA